VGVALDSSAPVLIRRAMARAHLHTRLDQGFPGGITGVFGERRFVVRRTALGWRVLVRHPYGRIARLRARPVDPAEAGDFASAEQVARALVREVLRREPSRAELRVVADRLLAGSGPRWEIGEDEVRAAAARLPRVA